MLDVIPRGVVVFGGKTIQKFLPSPGILVRAKIAARIATLVVGVKALDLLSSEEDHSMEIAVILLVFFYLTLFDLFSN